MPREKRLAHNEVLFREVNERIAELAGGWDHGFHILCECANTGCEERLIIPIAQYERIREHSRWFLIVPGHTVPEIEDVVERNDAYDVVEKHADVMPA